MNRSEINTAYKRLMLGFAIGIVIIVGVVCFYIYNFKSNPISAFPADWGSFGDFFGGILNPIISLYSLILLGFISYYIAKDSSNESNEMNMRLRRMDAYRELNEHLNAFEGLMIVLTDSLRVLLIRIKNDQHLNNAGEYLNEVSNRIQKPAQELVELQLFLERFPIQFAYLFNYNFESDDYLLLKSSVKNFANLARRTQIEFETIGENTDKTTSEYFGVIVPPFSVK